MGFDIDIFGYPTDDISCSYNIRDITKMGLDDLKNYINSNDFSNIEKSLSNEKQFLSKDEYNNALREEIVNFLDMQDALLLSAI